MPRRRSDIAELDISPEVFSFLLRLVDLRRNSRTFSEPCIVAMASHSGHCMGTAAEISQIESGTVEAWWSLAAPLTICCQFTLGQDRSNHGYDLCSSDKLTMICLGQQYEWNPSKEAPPPGQTIYQGTFKVQMWKSSNKSFQNSFLLLSFTFGLVGLALIFDSTLNFPENFSCQYKYYWVEILFLILRYWELYMKNLWFVKPKFFSVHFCHFTRLPDLGPQKTKWHRTKDRERQLTVNFVCGVELWQDDLSLVNSAHSTATSLGLGRI